MSITYSWASGSYLSLKRYSSTTGLSTYHLHNSIDFVIGKKDIRREKDG
jgi:hypothetical protein